MRILLIVICVVILILFLAGYYFYKFACIHDKNHGIAQDVGGENQTPWGKFDEEHKKDKQYLSSLEKEDIWITSRDGLKLHAYYMEGESPKRMVICCHGYKGRYDEDFAHAIKPLHQECSLLLIDERTCGQSEGNVISFGAKEKLDIIQWTEWLNTHKNINHLPIYLFGVSLGGGTVCMTSSYSFPKEVKGIIDDCGYSSMEDICNELAHSWFHIPGKVILPFMNIFCKALGHFDMKDANAKEALAHATVPVLFIHGTKDTFVIPKNTERNMEACSSKKDVLYIENATHAVSMYEDGDTYFAKVNDFFAKYDGETV